MAEPEGAAAWTSAPFEVPLADEVRGLVGRLAPAQRLWLSGYLAGSLTPSAAPIAAAAEPVQPRVTILFGSHSGNCERLANQAGEFLARCGVSFLVLDMLDCRKSHLQDARALLIIVSTHGEGEPPERALPLYELLHSRKAPKLDRLQYSVLALGDSSYEKFCETGRQFDLRLEALGARRLHERVECDVDFESSARQWIDAVAGQLTDEREAHVPRPVMPASAPGAAVSNAYTRKNPFNAAVLENQRLTARGSTKDVRHIELSLADSGIHYEPGDAIGVVPRNRAADVHALLGILPFDGEAVIAVGAQTMPLRQALLEQLDIGPITRSLVERYAAATRVDGPAALVLPGQETRLQRYLHGRHLIDLVVEHPPADLDAAGFAQLLRPLAPRLYSIASSQLATPEEAHLTVKLVEYRSLDRDRCGVVSGYLADLAGEEASAPIYLHRNPAFRLPRDRQAAAIMIGPGTGVAPFRGFMAEREALGAGGRNWLFFGDRTFGSDFLYQTDWLAWRKCGLLQRIDVAFSRDGADKVHVHHRMREQGRELFAWLEEGAHIYVCGDAEFMAPDVDSALREIIQQHGTRSPEQAAEYVLQLQRERRYQKDVY